MLKTLFILALCLGWGGVTGLAQRPRPRAAGTNAWMTYTSPDRRFSIQFPNTVGEEQFTYDETLPYLPGTAVHYDLSRDQRLEISWIDFLGAIGEPAEFKKARIRDFVAGWEANGGTALETKHVSFGNCEGEEATLRAPNPVNKKPSLVKARTFSSGGIVYFLFYFGNSEAPSEMGTADRFLNSFKVIGGCRDLVSVPAGANPLVWFSGTLDLDTGWHRVDSPYGATFLFPAPGQLRTTDEHTATGPIRRYAYEYESAEYVFTVQILEGYRAANRATAAQRKTELERYLTTTKNELTTNGYQVGECKSIGQGDEAGYDCLLKMSGNGLSGQARIFVTPTRNLFLTAFRSVRTADESALPKFLDSLKFEMK